MKHLLVLFLIFAFLNGMWLETAAGEYVTYQHIRFHRGNRRLLMDFTQTDYDRLYGQLGGRRFWGWRTVENLTDERVYFTRDTLYAIENEGTTPINQNLRFRSTQQSSLQVSASGDISLNVSGDIRRFRSGLDAHVSPEVSVKRERYLEEDVDIRVQVDPQTKLSIEVRGEGRISNGVGRQYRFFKNVRSGGWEVFVLTTEFYSIEKERI